MASESTPPPQPGGGGAKYAIAGVALLAIAGLAFCLTREEPPPPAPVAETTPDAGAGRSTALVEDEFEIPELEPDAGPPPDAGTTTTARRPPPTRSWDDCTGEIAAAAASQVIREHNAQIRNCYERQLKQNPMLEGNMTLAVRIAPNGSVDGTQVTGSLRDRDVFACVRSVASHMRFPPPGGRDCAVVQVPFQFTPRH
ncbi:Hypothetical protein I5071_46840 [Sandaracinus amylolyticus]|nr:Hypothetical protein I5071_46840 [Sandaracinus amylolyticus]